MAKFDKAFGIKEVADVAFYPVGGVQVDESGTDSNGKIIATEDPVLKFTSLKVSTIEMTAEQAEARGGKGNPPLIIWDYGREVNVTLEDALLSVDCMEAMYGSEGNNNVITVNAGKFPGTYSVVGKTFARDIDGVDHLFTYFIPKAKVNSENTITMEAEGDPSVFNLSLRVLRGNDEGDMIKFIFDPAGEAGVTPTIEFEKATDNN